MWKRLFAEHGVKNAITLFHKPNHSGSTKVLNLLKQANVVPSPTQSQTTSTEGGQQQTKFDLDIVEGPPTADQLRNILEYVGEDNSGKVITGASDAEEAMWRLRKEGTRSLQRPMVVDWNQGKVVVGDNEQEIKELLKDGA